MKLKRILAGMLSAAMIFSVGSTLAFAEDENDNESDVTTETTETAQSFTFNSVMYLSDDGISAPTVTYTYTLKAGDVSEDLSSITFNGIAPVDGTLVESTSMTGETLITDTATASFSAKDYAAAGEDKQVSKAVTFDLDSIDYYAPGVYYYTITETSTNTTDSPVVGLIDPTTNVRYLFVVVAYDANYNLGVSQTWLYDSISNLNTEKNEEFQHYYGVAPDDTANAEGEDFIVTDIAKGNLADTYKKFDFTITTDNIADYTILAVDFPGVSDEMGNSDTSVDYEAAGYIVIYNGKSYEAFYNDSSDTNRDTSGDYWYVYDSSSAKIKLEFSDTNSDPLTQKTLSEYTISMSSYNQFSILSVIDGMKFTITIEDPSDPDEGYAFWVRAYQDASYIGKLDESNAWVAGSYDADNTSTWVAWSLLNLDSGTNTYSHSAIVDTSNSKFEGIDFATVRGADDSDDDYGITYSAFTNTGVILEFAPFALMALAAGAAITLRVAKRRKEY